ncbi:hypothetical protein BGZ54_002825 [Gamsiella multidivaricata]|nr:hypothetical protein BGZ54_002825 [Gamsiella multidivaricata]
MPRQDYSLPEVVPLPKLATPRRATAPRGQDHHQVKNQTQPPAQAQAETQATAAEDNNTDDDYDMLDDSCDLLKELCLSTASTNDHGDEAPVTASTTAASTSATAVVAPEGSSPFVDMLLKEADKTEAERATEDANMTTTENGAPTYISTEDARLDFFFEVLQNTNPDTTRRLARASWAANPLDTLRLIFQLRSVVHGKGERSGFYVCMDFLRHEHPQTLLYNLRHIPDHGYWKDLLNWLVFEIRDDIEEYNLTTRPKKSKSSRGRGRGWGNMGLGRGGRGRGRGGYEDRSGQHKRQVCVSSDEDDEQVEKKMKCEDAASKTNADGARSRKDRTPEERQRAIDEAEERNQRLSERAREERFERESARLERARTMFKDDAFYRALHLEVARLFANALVRDKARLDQGQSISLAAKWCPSLNQLHDNYTLIASTIAQILFPEKRPGEDHVAYVNRVRRQYRQEYYVPLRKAIPVLESMMAAQRWDEIVYGRVPSIAMKNNKKLFEAHDKERFLEYLVSVSKGESTIAAQALMPHELVAEAIQHCNQGMDKDDIKIMTMEAQWKSYVERLAKTGTMESAMALCDVSGSMSGTPMNAAIALSLLLTQLSRPPYNRVVLTFSGSPQIHRVKEDSLIDQVDSMRNMDWGGNTDLAKAFSHILNLSLENKVAPKDMVKTLFVFSDMEFDCAVAGAQRNGEMFTNYAVVKRRFEQAGYELPQIVFWNLRGSNRGNKPTKSTQEGVAMVSGFSGMLMKLFLDGGDIVQAMDPVRLMEKAIHAKQFSRLKVLD